MPSTAMPPLIVPGASFPYKIGRVGAARGGAGQETCNQGQVGNRKTLTRLKCKSNFVLGAIIQPCVAPSSESLNGCPRPPNAGFLPIRPTQCSTSVVGPVAREFQSLIVVSQMSFLRERLQKIPYTLFDSCACRTFDSASRWYRAFPGIAKTASRPLHLPSKSRS